MTVAPQAATYRFEAVEACNMCGAPTGDAKVIGRRLNTHQGMRPTRTAGISTTVVRCQSCGLIFSNPMPVPGSVAQHYGTPPEEYWAEAYFEESEGYFREQIETFFRLWRGSGAPVALDIGSGIGKALRALTQGGFDTFGLEPSEPFFNRARELPGIDADHLQLSSVEDAEYPADRFDLVTFSAVLEHLYDPATAIERALRWTRPDGLVHIEIPSARWLTSRLVNLAYRLQGLDYSSNISPMHVPFHLYEFTLESFRRHGSAAGYRLVDHRWYVSDTYLPPILDPIVTRVMEATNTGMQLEVWLGRT